MAATVTVTGTVGAGGTLTAAVFQNVLAFRFDCVNNVLDLEFSGQVHEFISISAATTITATKSGSTYTLTVS